jgi:hypothetical protein
VEGREFRQECQVQPPKFPATVLSPILVTVSGQKLPGVQVERRAVGRGLAFAAGGRRDRLERLDVDP